MVHGGTGAFQSGEGQDDHGERWAVQHNGLGPDLAPNDLVVREGSEGQPTGFQTNNADKVGDPVELDDTLTNLEAASDGVFLEIYEQRLWEASRTNGGVLDPSKPVLLQRTLRDWSDLLYARQRAVPDAAGSAAAVVVAATHAHQPDRAPVLLLPARLEVRQRRLAVRDDRRALKRGRGRKGDGFIF